MTSSSKPHLERGLDKMLLAYSLLQGHPASAPCEQFIRGRSGWFVSPLNLFETRAVLVKVYGVPEADATRKIVQFAAGPVTVLAIDAATGLAARQQSRQLGIDLNDAVLLQLARAHGAAAVATEDGMLAAACQQFGIVVENPVDASLQQQSAAWEATLLAPKGLPRILHRIYSWLLPRHPQAAHELWSNTGAGSHLR